MINREEALLNGLLVLSTPGLVRIATGHPAPQQRRARGEGRAKPETKRPMSQAGLRR